MSNYDFKNISPYEFEKIIRDLLSAKEKIDFEIFSSGPDGGIDLRHVSENGELTIVQCKHYASSSFSNLKSNFRSHEVDKARSLNPDRYILATSLPLTPMKKGDLIKISDGLISNPGDIISCETINSWIREFPDIERRHMNLWATSTAVLEQILHSGIYSYSEYQKEEMKRKIGFYVKSECFYEAQEIIKSQKFCVIAGPPGVGKTTLAEILMIDYLNQGYDIVRVSSDIREAFDAFNEKEKKVYYYDDFLGQTGLDDKLNKNEDQGIIDFCNLCNRSSNSLFILTTREYILSRAKDIYGKLQSSSIDIRKCTVDINRYKAIDRARILYNHLFFGGIDQSYISKIISNDNYLKIISHQSFNPRVIEWMTVYINRDQISPDDYFENFIDTLKNPHLIWKHAFTQQITTGARILTLSTFLMPAGSSLADLKVQYSTFERLYCELYQIPKPRNFNRYLKEVDGNFIKTFEVEEDIKIDFHNPSIRDFIASEISEDSDMARCLISSCVAFDQLTTFYNAFPNHLENEVFSDAGVLIKFQDKLAELFYSSQIRPSILDKNKIHLNHNRILFILNCEFSTPTKPLKKSIRHNLNEIKYTIKSSYGWITIDRLLDSLKKSACVYDVNFEVLAEGIFEELLFSLDDISSIKTLSRIYKNHHTIDIEDLDKRTGLFNSLEETFESEADYYMDDFDELWSLRNDIEDIATNFNIDLGKHIAGVDFYIDSLDHPEDNEPLNETEKNDGTSDNIFREISAMFHSLK